MMNNDAGDNTTIKLISFNCKSFKRSADFVKSLSERADIIALQETWLLPHEISDLGQVNKDFCFFGKSAVDTSKGLLRGRPYGGVGLLWKNNVFDSVTVVPCMSERIIAIKVCVSDRFMLFFNVYMPTDELDNLVEFVECLSEISAIVDNENIETMYVLGDFNAHPGTLFGKEMLKFCLEQNWLAADIMKLGFDSRSYTFMSDIHGSCSWLDHCLTTQAAWKSVVTIKIHNDVYWSDHFPLEVQCDLTLVRRRSLSVQEFIINKVKWGERNLKQIDIYSNYCNDKLREIDFPYELSQCCDSVCDVLAHRSVIDKLYMSIVNTLCEASKYSYDSDREREIVKRHGRPILGWNCHVRDAHRDARQKFLNWIWHGKPHGGYIYNDMMESKRVFKRKLKFCQNNQDQIKMNKLAYQHRNKDFRGFWKHTKQLSPRAGTPVSVGGVNEPAKIANLFKSQFRVQSSLQSHVKVDAEVHHHTGASTHVPDRITARDIAVLINGMTGGKSPGHDCLSIEHFQFAGPHLPRLLALFFTLCMRHSYLPEELMRTVVVPILKNKTGDISDMCNYRPISLATTAAKILDSMLERQLKVHIKLNDAQFGFRSNLSTECAILSLKHTVGYYTVRNTPVYAAFLDLSKAFDLVRYDILWDKLRKAGLPVSYISIFSYWYDHQINQVRWSSALSDEYRLECGVRQGGLTSPTLFNLYINELIDRLGSARVGCSIDGLCMNNISYADDMVLLSPSVCALRRLLFICEVYAEAHGLKYNVAKSELMVFKVGTKKPNFVPPVTLGGVALKRVTEFKYLGHVVTEDLKDDKDIERERRALAVRCNMLARRFSRCTAEVKVILFKAYCQSLYTCALWVRYTRRAYNTLRTQYNNAFRLLLGLPRYCSASGMFVDAHVDNFSTLIRKRTASLMHRVRGSANSILNVISEKPECAFLRHWVHVHVPIASDRHPRYMN